MDDILLWYKKLKDSGFKDIENDRGELRESRWFKKCCRDPLYFYAKQEYYYRATQFLYSYAFNSHNERTIWEMHCNGKTFPEIAKVTNIYYTTANRIVLKLRKIMLTHLSNEGLELISETSHD